MEGKKAKHAQRDIHPSIHLSMHTYIHTHIHIIHTYVHAHIQTYKYTNIHTYKHTPTHRGRAHTYHTYVHACMLAHLHTDTHPPTHRGGGGNRTCNIQPPPTHRGGGGKCYHMKPVNPYPLGGGGGGGLQGWIIQIHIPWFHRSCLPTRTQARPGIHRIDSMSMSPHRAEKPGTGSLEASTAPSLPQRSAPVRARTSPLVAPEPASTRSLALTCTILYIY